MTDGLKRRTVLIGGVVATAVVVAAGGGYAALRLLPASSADDEEAGYAKLLAAVEEDYVNGRVVEHQGWVMSQHEFDTLANRAAEAARDRPAIG